MIEDLETTKKIIELEKIWEKYHLDIVKIVKSKNKYKYSSCCHTCDYCSSDDYILLKRKKIQIECAIELLKNDKITKTTMMLRDYWDKKEINDGNPF